MGNSSSKKKKLKEVTDDTYKGKTNNLQQELSRLKTEYKDNFVPLYDRKWVEIESNLAPEINNSTTKFSMLQFNILADGLSGAYNTGLDGFDTSPKESLNFKYRGFRIIEEIINASPDIITLEEVDTFGFLSYYLEPFGYSGIHQPKERSPCISIGKLNKMVLPPDGVAIFYKNEKFQIIKENIYKYTKPVAMLIHFKFIECDKEFVIGVTHLKAAKTKRGESIRLKQLNFLLPEWLKIKKQLNNIDLFIGCDFNSPNINTCGFAPMAYNSVVNGKLFIDKYIKNENEEKLDDNNIEIPKDYIEGYGLNMASAYLEGLGMEPQFTTYKSRKKSVMCHTIDYIFYEKNKWDVIELFSIPSDDDVKNRKTYIPAFDYPSDHFAIGAVFALNS